MTVTQENNTLDGGVMKRWVIKAGATSLASLHLESASIPEPKKGEVRVKMHAASINYRDQIVLQGTYGVVTHDIIALSDGAGEIDALGEGVTQWKLGNRVTSVYAAEEWTDGPPTPGLTFGLGAEGMDGVLAEYIILSENRITAAPESLSFTEASTIPCAGLTAWTALNGDRPYTRTIGPDDTVLVLGSGGVSLFALLLAQAAGTKVIGTSSTPEKLKRFKALGAVDAINYAEHVNWGELVFEKTGGVKRVVNAVGGSATGQAIAAVGPGGEIATMGMFDLGGKAPDYIALMMKGASIRGTAVGSAAAHRDLVKFIDEHHVKPPIDKVYAFDDAKDAFRAAASRDLFGKIVIEIRR